MFRLKHKNIIKLIFLIESVLKQNISGSNSTGWFDIVAGNDIGLVKIARVSVSLCSLAFILLSGLPCSFMQNPVSFCKSKLTVSCNVL